jgi:hypothetical protein
LDGCHFLHVNASLPALVIPFVANIGQLIRKSFTMIVDPNVSNGGNQPFNSTSDPTVATINTVLHHF